VFWHDHRACDFDEGTVYTRVFYCQVESTRDQSHSVGGLDRDGVGRWNVSRQSQIIVVEECELPQGACEGNSFSTSGVRDRESVHEVAFRRSNRGENVSLGVVCDCVELVCQKWLQLDWNAIYIWRWILATFIPRLARFLAIFIPRLAWLLALFITRLAWHLFWFISIRLNRVVFFRAISFFVLLCLFLS